MALFKNKTVDQCISVLSSTLEELNELNAAKIAEHKEHMEIASAAFSEACRAERVATVLRRFLSEQEA